MKQIKLKRSFEVQFTEDSNNCITISRDMNLYDIQSGEKIWRVHPLSNPSDLILSHDNNFIAVKNTVGEIKIINKNDGSIMNNFAFEREGEGCNMEYSLDDKFIVNGTWSGVVKIIDSNNGNINKMFCFHREMIVGILKNKNKNIWYSVHHPKAKYSDKPHENNYIIKWTWPFGDIQPVKLPIDFHEIDNAKLSISNNYICFIDHFGSRHEIVVVDINNYKTLWINPFEYAGSGSAVCWSKDDKYIAAVQKGGITFYESMTGKIVSFYEIKYPCAIDFSNNNQYIAIGSWENGIISEINNIIKK
ncbi:hypothetical protein AGMMS49579_22710 [Spirochaetia bacterium]|nr:hypothetical protein AGMMS49579_22710 [Spirochaetia bacterium]